MVKIVAPKHTRLMLVLSVPVLWAVLAFTFAHAEHAQRESNVQPIDSLILAVFPLVTLLPLTIKRLTAMRLFPLYLSIWMGATIPSIFFLFGWAAEYSHKCDYLFYGGGLFAMAGVCGSWWFESIKARRQLRIRSEGMSEADR